VVKHELTSKEESGLRRGGWRSGLLLLSWGDGDSQDVIVTSGGAHSNERVRTTGPRVRSPARHHCLLGLQQYKEVIIYATPPNRNATRNLQIKISLYLLAACIIYGWHNKFNISICRSWYVWTYKMKKMETLCD
jgi:hypothetical protein